VCHSDLAADAVGLLDALGVSAAHVVGFSSLGGGTAQKMVIEHTARVSSLTLISAGTAAFGMPAPDPEAQKALEAVGQGASKEDQRRVDVGVNTLVTAAKVLMSEANFDEARVAATARLAHERAPPADSDVAAQGFLMRRQLCSQIADEPREKALQQAVLSMPKNAAACARGQLSATLTTTEQITPTEMTAKAYTAFVCEVRRDGELVNTLKDRYSSFLDLRDRLEANTIWSEQIKAIEFPPKSVFGSFESTIVKNRIEGITKWFAEVLSTPGLKDCYELCSFLGVPCGEASPVVIVHGAKDMLLPIDHGKSCAKGCVGADLVIVEEMGHEICSFGPSLYEPIFNAIKVAAERSGNPATMASEPEPEGEPASTEEGVPPEDAAKIDADSEPAA
jgi:pimeloyl-ACP methyl ester carboxylesterase